MSHIDSPRVNPLDKYRHRLEKHVGNCGFVKVYTKQPSGAPGYAVGCRICGYDGKKWTTKHAAKKLPQLRLDRTDDYQTVMALWVTHMRVHHSDRIQPIWEIDENAAIEDMERKFFEPREVSPEEILLNQAKARMRQQKQDQEAALIEVREVAAQRSVEHRAALTQLRIDRHPVCERIDCDNPAVGTVDVNLNGPAYPVDTVRAVCAEHLPPATDTP